eukprot:COSAG04_NODE_2866_length_3451_cov_2.751492_1_plen_93_part_00
MADPFFAQNVAKRTKRTRSSGGGTNLNNTFELGPEGRRANWSREGVGGSKAEHEQSKTGPGTFAFQNVPVLYVELGTKRTKRTKPPRGGTGS